MIRRTILIGAALVLTINLGCLSNGTNGTNGETAELHKVYVERIDVFPEANSVEVRVTGQLPSSAYTFARFDVMLMGSVIQIIPLAQFDPDIIATQRLVPFEKTTRAENLDPGTYEVRVIGQDDFVITRRVVITG